MDLFLQTEKCQFELQQHKYEHDTVLWTNKENERFSCFFPSVVAHPKSVQTSLETRLRKIIQLTVSVTVLLLIARREASSETQGLLAGTMRYFSRKFTSRAEDSSWSKLLPENITRKHCIVPASSPWVWVACVALFFPLSVPFGRLPRRLGFERMGGREKTNKLGSNREEILNTRWYNGWYNFCISIWPVLKRNHPEEQPQEKPVVLFQFTLTVPLSSLVYKWVLTNLMLGIIWQWTIIQW